MREKYLEEFALSLVLGELVTLVMFVLTREQYSMIGLIIWWSAMHIVATYAVWTILDIIQRIKGLSWWSSIKAQMKIIFSISDWREE